MGFGSSFYNKGNECIEIGISLFGNAGTGLLLGGNITVERGVEFIKVCNFFYEACKAGDNSCNTNLHNKRRINCFYIGISLSDWFYPINAYMLPDDTIHKILQFL